MLTFHVIPLFLVIASEAWNLKVCACAMILDSSLRSATFRMTECQHYLVPPTIHRDDLDWFLTRADPRGRGPPCVMQANRTPVPMAVSPRPERAGQADQDGRPSGAARAAIDLSVIRGVGSSTVVRGSVGSYRPVIAGAKLREGITTILPRGRALQGVGLSSMRFHPTGRGHEDDEDGHEGCSTSANASLIG